MSITPAQESAIQPKQKLSGTVAKTTLVGAVIDLGLSVPGVLHISQLQKDAVNKVEDVLQVGQTVETWVRRVKADRIELTMIEPVGMDWRELKPETIVKGKVVRVESYGAFVEIGAERPGLVHISELAHGYVKVASDVVKEGDEIDVMILEADRRKKQIRLSIKATQEAPEEKEEEIKLERKPRGKKSSKTRMEFLDDENKSSEPEPTVMESAWKKAMERQKAEKIAAKALSKAKADAQEDDIIARTLKNRVVAG
jgi:small subunit ribosomal protein S1